MDSKKWEAFLSAVDAGSFTHAAEKLGYTQSGLTHMMNSLEKEVGFSLLTRGHYGVKLTSAGERLLPAIREFTRTGERLERELAIVSGAKLETIRISTYASIASNWLPAIVKRFRADHPSIQVDILLVNSVQELCDSLRNDRADLAFGGWQKGVPLGSFHWVHLKNDPLLAVLPRDYPIGERTAFPLAEFEGKEFLISEQGFDPTILEVMEDLGIRPDIRPTAVDDLTVIQLVSHGLGVSILAELVLDGRREEVLALPLEPNVSRELGIFSRLSRDADPILRKFISYAEHVLYGLDETEDLESN